MSPGWRIFLGKMRVEVFLTRRFLWSESSTVLAMEGRSSPSFGYLPDWPVLASPIFEVNRLRHLRNSIKLSKYLDAERSFDVVRYKYLHGCRVWGRQVENEPFRKIGHRDNDIFSRLYRGGGA